MKTPLQLDDLNLDAAAKIQVAARVQSLLDQAKSETAKYYEADLHAKDLKIQALILELAHLRRIRYGVKNEALSSLQRDVLRDICNEDIAALEAEVEQIEDDQVNATAPNPSVRVPVANPCHRIYRALSISMNRNPANAVGAARTWSRLAKTSPNNWMSSPPSFSCIVTSVRNMPAVPAKPSPQHRFRPLLSMAAWQRWVC